MTDKTPLDLFMENVSFSSVKRDILGEATAKDDLQKELFYYKSQASHGPEKSRAAMASKAKEIEAEIEKMSAKTESVEEIKEETVVETKVEEKIVAVEEDTKILDNFKSLLKF